MSIPLLRQHANHIWYVHWTDGRRSKRISLKTGELAVAKARFSKWLLLPLAESKHEAAPQIELEPNAESHREKALNPDGEETYRQDPTPKERNAFEVCGQAKALARRPPTTPNFSKGIAKTYPIDAGGTDLIKGGELHSAALLRPSATAEPANDQLEASGRPSRAAKQSKDRQGSGSRIRNPRIVADATEIGNEHMPDTPAENIECGVAKPTKLFTESEVAERLVCSVSKIRKLRENGVLPYLPGRPPLIFEKDLEVLLLAELDRAVARKERGQDRRRALEEANQLDPAEVEADAQAAAQEAAFAAARLRAQRNHLRRRIQQQATSSNKTG